MRDKKAKEIDRVVRTQVYVPMYLTEIERFSRHLAACGVKKGAFVRLAIIEKLNRDQRSCGDEPRKAGGAA